MQHRGCCVERSGCRCVSSACFNLHVVDHSRSLQAQSGVPQPSRGHDQGRLGLGMGLAATQCGKGGLRGRSLRGSSPAKQPTTGECLCCRYRPRARASKLVKHQVHGALWRRVAPLDCQSPFQRVLAIWPIWTRQRRHQCPHNIIDAAVPLPRGRAGRLAISAIQYSGNKLDEHMQCDSQHARSGRKIQWV